MNTSTNGNGLIPFVSTHFIWEEGGEKPFLTQNKIYPIKEWEKKGYGYVFSFIMDNGVERAWLLSALGLRDYSYQRNLEKILE